MTRSGNKLAAYFLLFMFISAAVLCAPNAWTSKSVMAARVGAPDKKGKDKKDKKEKQQQEEKEAKAKKEKQTKSAESKEAVKNNDKKKSSTSQAQQAAKAATAASQAAAPPKTGKPVAEPAAGQPVVAPPAQNVPMPATETPLKKEESAVTADKPANDKPANDKPANEQAGKDKPVEDGSDTFRINSSLVAVPVSVTNTQGEPVRNLKAEEFKLEEEGELQQVQSLGEPGKTPLELTLLFDISGSVFERFDFQKQAASRFLQQVLKPNDVVSVFLVGFEGKLVIPRTRNFPQVISELMALQPTKEGTAFHASVVRAANYLNDNAETGSRRVMVVISDGEDNYSKTVTLADAQRDLQRGDIVFYSINPSGPSIKLNRISMKGQNVMLSLANETGGVAFLPDKEEELDRVFRQIAAELQAQYLLGYYSTNEANDGQFRRIKIQLPQHVELRIRARQGYYAPKE